MGRTQAGNVSNTERIYDVSAMFGEEASNKSVHHTGAFLLRKRMQQYTPSIPAIIVYYC